MSSKQGGKAKPLKAPKAEKKEYDEKFFMPITRSMSRKMSQSGTTQENDTVSRKVFRQVPDPPGYKSRNYTMMRRRWSVEDDAFNIFMMKDYLKRYYETHPHPAAGLITDEADFGGRTEWTNMSNTDKIGWIEYAKKREEEGATLQAIRAECYATYSIHY